jgi:hypothetical protein
MSLSQYSESKEEKYPMSFAFSTMCQTLLIGRLQVTIESQRYLNNDGNI